MPPKYSVVIPVYNGSSTLATLVLRLEGVFSKLKVSREIIFVDDGSPDNSWKILQGLRVKNKRVKLIQLARNYGQHNAVLCGLKSAQGSYVQHPPEEIPKLILEIAKGFDVVYGIDPIRRHGKLRNIATQMARGALRAAIPGLHKYTSFRIMTSDVANHLGDFQTPFTFIDGYITWVTQKIGSVKVTNRHRGSGTSGYGFIKLVAYTANRMGEKNEREEGEDGG